MLSIRSVTLLFALLASTTSSTGAFQGPFAGSVRQSVAYTTAVNMASVQNEDNSQDASVVPTSRRSMLQSVVGWTVAATAAVATTTTMSPQPAVAKYSDYSRREKDWQERLEKDQVKISSARDLRRQLAEIAPMNNEGSKIFCPNGPSANVTPLMENKCGDRMAIPSVYGRTQDTVGNSIPGFSSAYVPGMATGGSSSIAAEIGGFPTYKTGYK